MNALDPAAGDMVPPPAPAPGAVPDVPAHLMVYAPIRAAHQQAVRAATAATRAEHAAAAAALSIQDAAGALEVATAKAEHTTGDPQAPEWRVTAALEAVSKAERNHERAIAKRERLEGEARQAAELADLAADGLAALVEAVELAAGTPEPAAEPEPAPEPMFATLPQFVEQFIAIIYAADIGVGGQRRWCAQWWRHPGVVVRLEAVWRAFEHLRLDPATGMSVLLRDHADPHMAVITAPGGPLDQCKPTDHKNPPEPLTLVETQDGLYTPENA